MARGKIRITYEQLRMAAKKSRRGNPPCHDETMKVLNALEAAKWKSAPLYKYVLEADACFEAAKEEKKRGKASTLYYLSQYLVQNKFKTK
mmetsp:Transcript_4375/g.7842  ORF Transcript_4375/g.7842 Transcript_4375/m.7842 type:complete len:90 (-) Transcript_4375:123-392(-)|eukprot:CAMPEP_0198281098 /NCGR_PEP_ID=MMETSP1449-20131203/1096_1 /TAXON_ID=420275 /ORGANISM="Attheya septentrionalis, Strain CCMP2084" /LENGTH=89 /DNA_ID=CAMNT_0043976731 /DNA_START=155 /DNA_END=424 /DNA_ORIENTATION=-